LLIVAKMGKSAGRQMTARPTASHGHGPGLAACGPGRAELTSICNLSTGALVYPAKCTVRKYHFDLPDQSNLHSFILTD